jgi:O-antigen/teichoic acid export membrane protein
VNDKGDVPMDQESALAGEQSPDADISAIGHKAGRGVRWALSGTVLVKVGSFAMGLVLVRLIGPHDFGLYAVAFAANTFLIQVNNMGVIAATVQWRGRIEELLPTGATLAVAFSVAWYALFWVAAPQLPGSPEATPLFDAGGAGLIVYLLVVIRPRPFSKFIASGRRGEVQE